jgi:hypothetical protein
MEVLLQKDLWLRQEKTKLQKKIAQSKKLELNKKNAEDDDLSEKISEEDNILRILAEATESKKTANG